MRAGSGSFAKAALGAAFFVGCMMAAVAARAEGGPARALVAAAEAGDLATIEKLIGNGVAVDARDDSGRTALLAATHANKPEAARVLIAAGADVNVKDRIGDSAFLFAGAEGRNEILKLTLPRADLKSTNRYGGTALIPAAHHGHVETVKILLGTAIDKDHVNRLGWTALLEAVILGNGGAVHTEIVRLLVEAGANVNIADRDGVTPLAHARRRGYGGIIRLLQAKGAR